MGDSCDLTPPQTIWIAATFMMMFVVDHISRLLHACADAEASSEVEDMLIGLPRAPKFFTFSRCVKTTNIIDITGMTCCTIAANRCTVVSSKASNTIPLSISKRLPNCLTIIKMFLQSANDQPAVSVGTSLRVKEVVALVEGTKQKTLKNTLLKRRYMQLL
eukprot:TRINITY_DN54233_c0_g1_i1.p2 TRINITY_DN54233_c0_g1~~TRINITY_DN54233_c0_g1_i1.p2  ORF type:complete len:161 (-),score=19.21 TRINITY_DN54233_c0_g1_i1:43-525(-)